MVEEISDEYPNLVDFLGFTEGEGMGMDIENEGEAVFEEHLDMDGINDKLKKGQIF